VIEKKQRCYWVNNKVVAKSVNYQIKRLNGREGTRMRRNKPMITDSFELLVVFSSGLNSPGSGVLYFNFYELIRQWLL